MRSTRIAFYSKSKQFQIRIQHLEKRIHLFDGAAFQQIALGLHNVHVVVHFMGRAQLFAFLGNVPVSYTHLDVYKRQVVWQAWSVAEKL